MDLAGHALSLNERRLLGLLRAGAASTRAGLAGATGLTAATVSRLLSGLVAAGYVEEAAERAGLPGQPQRRLALRPGQAPALGLNFMRGRFDVAVVDLAGGVMLSETRPLGAVTADTLVAAATSACASACGRLGLAPAELVGVGVSAPGGFAPDGVSLRAHEGFMALDGLDLGALVGEALGAPGFAETDGGCAALGEMLHGAGRGLRSFFLIHLGHGVGGGAIIERRLYRGPHGNASKPGALFPYGAPRPSAQDLLLTLRAASVAVDDIADITPDDPAAAAPLGAWIARAGGQIGDVLRLATAFLDPQAVILGGRLPPSINHRLVSAALCSPLAPPSRGLPIAPLLASDLGPAAGALGAASLPHFAAFLAPGQPASGNAYVDGRRTNGGSAAPPSPFR